ncbi:recF protein [Salmonella enterica subsp. enterica]|uniref:RecF protein n=1 Tax=Salmonella enterica I TaxID=59201 RepID=A0A379VHP8_SALET|nr:recF protein [Salmonella enterica subsp. enterica]
MKQLRPWDKELIPLAEQISTWRAEYSSAIAPGHGGYLSASFYPEFSLTFSFQRGWEKETDYADVLERSFERDRMLTYTAAPGRIKRTFAFALTARRWKIPCRAGS